MFFDLTVERGRNRPAKVLRVSGEVWGNSQIALARKVEEGSSIKITGCLKEGNRFDLERLLSVVPS